MGRSEDREPKKALSLRWNARLLEATHARAARSDVSFNQLTERYVAEGLRMDEHPLIYFRSGPRGRRPALMGTRLDVATVIATVRQNDNSVDQAAGYLGIPRRHVEACVGYYVEFQVEVDDWIEQAEEEAAAAEISWRRRHEIFA